MKGFVVFLAGAGIVYGLLSSQPAPKSVTASPTAIVSSNEQRLLDKLDEQGKLFTSLLTELQAAQLTITELQGTLEAVEAEKRLAKSAATCPAGVCPSCGCADKTKCSADSDYCKLFNKELSAATPTARAEREPYQINETYTYSTGGRWRRGYATGTRKVWVYDESGVTYYCANQSGQGTGYSGGSCSSGSCR